MLHTPTMLIIDIRHMDTYSSYSMDQLTGKLPNKQQFTTSTTEAEILAVSATTKETIWWKRFFHNININVGENAVIYTDNMQSHRLLTQNDERLATKLKHVDIHNLWVRQCIQQNKLLIKWIPTAEMAADGFTKCLPIQKHLNFVRQLGMENVIINGEANTLGEADGVIDALANHTRSKPMISN